MYMQSIENASLIKAKLDQGAMWSKLKLIQTNLVQILDTPSVHNANDTETKIDTDLEKTYKYFEAGIYNDKILQKLSEANDVKTKQHLLSVSERVLDFLVCNEQFVILTNKNYLYTCSVAESSKLKKLLINYGDESMCSGITMCQCTESLFVVLLSNGVIKFIDLNQDKNISDENPYEDVKLLPNSRYKETMCGFDKKQLLVIMGGILKIFNIENGYEKTVPLSDDVKAFQIIKGIDKDTKLVSIFILTTGILKNFIKKNLQAMLLQNGTVIIHFLK